MDEMMRFYGKYAGFSLESNGHDRANSRLSGGSILLT